MGFFLNHHRVKRNIYADGVKSYGDRMYKCPKCGADVEKPLKTWQLAPKGRKPVTVGLFKCPKCGAYFRKGVK